MAPAPSHSTRRRSILDVAGIRVGHATHPQAATGCTVVLCGSADNPQGAVAGVDVRGGGPATREFALLDPSNLVQRVDAVLLTGGSAFGLAAADGVMHWLRAHDTGFPTPHGRVPIVPTCAIFDLGQGASDVFPTREDGAAACDDALNNQTVRGTIGAGTGAAIGKLTGHEYASAGGIGSAGLITDTGLQAGAMVVANPLGDVVDPDSGAIVAGARSADGDRADPQPGRPASSQSATSARPATPVGSAAYLQRATNASVGFGPGTPPPAVHDRTNTTLAVFATNAPMTKADATRVARMASAGMARAIVPGHTPFDGDVVIALSTAASDSGTALDAADVMRIGSIAAGLVSDAILDAAWSATGRPGLPTARELGWARER